MKEVNSVFSTVVLSLGSTSLPGLMSFSPGKQSGEHKEIVRVPQTLRTGWKLWSTTKLQSPDPLKVSIE